MQSPLCLDLDGERYARHISLKNVGYGGVERLRRSSVLVIGAGGLGSPALYYLAAAGVGTLGISDDDQVHLSNLQRQILHFEANVGQLKGESARQKIAALNRQTRVVLHNNVNPQNVETIMNPYDFIIEGSDDVHTKFLVNKTGVRLKKCFSIGGVLRYSGQTLTVRGGESPCYQCLFEKEPKTKLVESCEEAGVLGVVPGVIGTTQALEAIKYILDIGELLTGRLLVFDALSTTYRTIHFQKRCPLCCP